MDSDTEPATASKPLVLSVDDETNIVRAIKRTLRRAGVKGKRYRALEQGMQLVRAGKIEQLQSDTEELNILKQWLAAPSKRGIYKFAR